MIKKESISRDDDKWVNEKILLFDESLRQSFNEGKEKFLQAVVYSLSTTTSAVGAVLYEYRERTKDLIVVAGYAASIEAIPIPLGDQLVGQCAKSKKVILLRDIGEEIATVDLADSKVSLRGLFLVPLVFNDNIYGVIELRYVEDIPVRVEQFVQRAADNAVVMIESIRKNAETHAQKEKLTNQEKILKRSIDKLNKAKSEVEQQKSNIENTLKTLSIQNKRIEESIAYAQRIQQAILPSEQKLKTVFRDAFVIFKPKDIVSGDFYWYSTVENYQFLAVVDCTGHGVPGAFMSMIGNTLLNQIILEKKIHDPALVLSNIHQGIRLNLLQESNENVDGMDMFICRFEQKGDSGQVEAVVAGAKSYFYSFNNGNNEVDYFKGNSQSIGGAKSHEDLKFDQKAFELAPHSKLILLTDGWLDNANKLRRRYGSKRFRNLLKDNVHLPFSDLRKKLEDDMSLHQGKEDQRDDITLLGIEI